VLKMLDDCVTTEAAVSILRDEALLSKAMEKLGADIEDTLKRQVLPDVEVGYVCFIDDEILTRSGNALTLIKGWKPV